MPRGKAIRNIALIEAAEQILAEIQPCSVRAVCYRLFSAGVIESMEVKHTARVSRQLVEARERGVIPWGWIVDETREAEVVPSWRDPAALLEAARRQYRKDAWVHQPVRVQVWSEKGTVRGTLLPVLRQWGVTFRVMHGFGSATVINDIAEESRASDTPLVAFYVGDYDPSGLYMSEVDLPRRLAAYGAAVDLRRVALGEQDVADPDLPPFDVETKRRDRCYAWFWARYGGRCWELDALPPPVRLAGHGSPLRWLKFQPATGK